MRGMIPTRRKRRAKVRKLPNEIFEANGEA